MKSTLMALSVLALTACASTGNVADTEAKKETFVAARTIVSDQGKNCSLDVKPLRDPEAAGLLADLAAPFLYNLASAGFDALGAAITSAAEEKAKTHNPPKQAISLVTAAEEANVDPVNFPSSLKLSRKPACVRTIYGRFSLESETGIWVDKFTTIPITSFASKEQLLEAIKDPIDANLPGSIEEMFFYSEHWVEPVEGAAGEFYYRIVPVVLWYNKAIEGSRYKLTTVSFSMQTPGVSDDASVLSFSHTFEPDGVSPGTIYTINTGGLTPSGLYPAPALTESETKAIAAIETSTNTFMTANAERNGFGNYGQYDTVIAEIEKRKAEFALKKCYVAAAGKADKKELCDLTKGDNAYKAEKLTSVAVAANKGQDLLNISKQINGLGAKLSNYNVGVSFTESREANKFFLAVGKALTQSKEQRDEVLKNYVNSQLGITEDSSNLAAMNSYRAAKVAYDIALRKYNEAQLAGDQEAIDAALITLVTKYNELTSAAQTAGVVVTEPDPYP